MDATDPDQLRQMTRELVTSLREFTSGQSVQSGSRLYAALQTAARSNVLDPTIQSTEKSLLRELRRILVGPSRTSDSEVAAAKRLALEVYAWLAERPDFQDPDADDAPKPPLPTRS